MKNILLFMIGTALLISCSSLRPIGFTYNFEDKYTGLDTLINIDGYYIYKKRLDNKDLSSICMFYSNGIFARTNMTKIIPEKVDSFTGKDPDYRFIDWGTYRISNDTIHTELIITDGWLPRPEAIKNDYIILLDPISPKEKTIGCIVKGDSLHYIAIGKFHRLESKRDYNDCLWLKKKWFYKGK